MEQKHSSNAFGVKEDTLSKAEDDKSLSDGGDTILNTMTNVGHFSFENVRFSPSVIEFTDAFEGKQFAEKITIQNIGRNPVLVKIGEPNSFIFQVKKPSKRKRFLASGASITKIVSYTYHNVDLIQKSQIPIQINGHLVDYPIVVKRAVPDLEIQPQKLDFKTLNLGASAKTLVLSIINKGGKRTKFKVDVGKNILDMAVTPMRGTIKPKSQVNVLVEMMGANEGEYYHELWIKTNEVPIRVPVLMNVVRPRLEIVYPNGTDDFTLVAFKPTFNGTQKAQSFVLKNHSTDATLFNTLAEVNGEIEILENARSSTDAFKMFTISAEEGRLEPFENRIITVLFSPKLEVSKKPWKHIKSEKMGTQTEYVAFLRINRVHRIERREITAQKAKKKASMVNSELLGESKEAPFDFSSEVDDASTDRATSMFTKSLLPEQKVLRLCLFGIAVEPEVLVQPDSFTFETLNLGETAKKVLRVTNKSSIAVKCKLCKTVNVRTDPSEIWLEGESVHEFAVSLKPTCAGNFKTKMKVEFLGLSDSVFELTRHLEVIATHTVSLIYTAKDIVKALRPKIGLGITPLLTDDVGLQKDYITFKNASEYPAAAMLGLKHGFETDWMKAEEDKLNNVDNAIIAMPNDRPRLFYTWPKDKICRAIFSGLYRYSPPEDLDFTLSPEERDEKKKQLKMWFDYIQLLKTLRKLKHPTPKDLFRLLEYDISCKNHYKMKQIKLSSEFEPTEENARRLTSCKKQIELSPDYTFIPLSPMLLSNVTVVPKFIDFDKVAVGTVAEQSVTIINMNTFPISVKFVSGKSAVSVVEQDTIIIQSAVTKDTRILFQSSNLGRYFGFLNYVINGSHEFKITISALVSPKTISLGSGSINLEFGLYDSREAFQPRSVFLPLENLLLSPVKYRWSDLSESAFVINLMEGEIPPRSKLLAEVLFDMSPGKSFYSDATLISESGASETVKMIHPSKKVFVNFLNNRLDMRDIPLNLPTKAEAIIENASYHNVTFEVVDCMPLPGIAIEPRRGIIKARSFFPLIITVQVPVIMKFNIQVFLMVHFVNKISIKVSGNVVAPEILIRPSEVIMRKICAQAVDVFPVCVENIGNTPAEVAIDFKNCPEYSMADNINQRYLLPKQKCRFLIKFEPKDVSRYMFYLPVIVNRMLGPPELQEPQTEFVDFYTDRFESSYEGLGVISPKKKPGSKIPCVCLNSTVSQSLVTISKLSVNFKLENTSNAKFQPQEIVFSNEFNQNVTFCIRNDDLGEINDSPFNLVPLNPKLVENRLRSMKAQLEQGEKLVMQATFEPKKPGSYDVDVPIFVRGYSNGLVYNFINLKGELNPPLIIPEVSEVHFSPLPLDVYCDVVVIICAENFMSAEVINCLIYDPKENNEASNQCLKTKWITEPLVLPCQKKYALQLQISFKSSIPIALKNYIVLFDSTGTYATIFVTATADNSVLTTHTFLSTRSMKYKLVREKPPTIWKDNELVGYPVNKFELKTTDKTLKEKRMGSKAAVGLSAEYSEGNITNNACSLQIDKGPRLVVQETKSTTKNNYLGFVNLSRRHIECSSTHTLLSISKNKRQISLSNKSDSGVSSKTLLNSAGKKGEVINDITFPNFPTQNGTYKSHIHGTRDYVERWIFEVVMKCNYYFSIPESFQYFTWDQSLGKRSSTEKPIESRKRKNFLDFLGEILGPEKKLLKWKNSMPENRSLGIANKLRSLFAEIVHELEKEGCLMPHVKPEFLMTYENYVSYTSEFRNVETISWDFGTNQASTELEKINSMKVLQDGPTATRSGKVGPLQDSPSLLSSRESWRKSLFDVYLAESKTEKIDEKAVESSEGGTLKLKVEPQWVAGRQLEHEVEILDETNFNLRSTQAWLDVLIQIFKVFVLKNVVFKTTIPFVSLIGMKDKMPIEQVVTYCPWESENQSENQSISTDESFSSNVFSIQERILLNWLNRHCQMQEKLLWEFPNSSESPRGRKIINNFDKDLSDSVALISVTASHCPYIVSQYFKDIFFKADTPNKLYHNAAKLILAWRTVGIGLTVETADIVQPNPLFMIILVTRLYDVLPTLHPHSLICFSSPLNTEIVRVIQLRNDSDKRVIFKPKFFGEYEEFFSLGSSSSFIDLKPKKTVEVSVKFTARKIKKISATLLLNGCCVSPDFAKHLVFYLEGEPSQLQEQEKYSFTTPLYKVACITIPVKPPYPKAATYEIWYTTKKPEYSEVHDISVVIKPWSKILNRKVSRRLFLSKNEVTVEEDGQTSLDATVACLTDQSRMFWLLFRSKVIDFIIRIEIKPKSKGISPTLIQFKSDNWSSSATCLCSNWKQLPRSTNFGPNSCPFLIELKIPTRNEILWDALFTMFLKTVQPHEKSFWSEYFEVDIGICLIMWLLSPQEEEEVVDEFIEVLSTRVTYSLQVEPPNNTNVVIPKEIEISDVRKKSEISVPIHISNSTTSPLRIKMTSGNGKEIRKLEIELTKAERQSS